MTSRTAFHLDCTPIIPACGVNGGRCIGEMKAVFGGTRGVRWRHAMGSSRHAEHMSRRRFSIVGFLIAVVIAASVSGCRSSTRIGPEQTQEAEPITEITRFAAGLRRYMETKGHPPASKEDFRDFCSSSGLPCHASDWGKYSWESVDDKMLTVIYDGGTYSMPIVVSLDGTGVPQDKVREQLRDSMK